MVENHEEPKPRGVVESPEDDGAKHDSLTTLSPPILTSETRAVEAKPKKAKHIVSLIILGVVVVSSIITWSVHNKKNAYVTKANKSVAIFNKLVLEEGATDAALAEGLKQVETNTDPTSLQAGCSGLADKYIPIFQGYYDRLKSIKDEFALMRPPSEFQKFHDLFLRSCDSFCKGFTSYMDAFRLLQNINESTGSQVTGIAATAARYLKEGNDLSTQANQAHPK